MSQVYTHQWNNQAIQQRTDDSYVCLTDMAKACNRNVYDYLRLPKTIEYIEALANDLKALRENLVTVKRGGVDGGSTWAHPEIAIDFAQWVSMSFKIWANRALREIIQTGTYTAKPEDRQHFEPFNTRMRLQQTQNDIIDRLGSTVATASHEDISALAAALDVTRKALQDTPNKKRAAVAKAKTAIAKTKKSSPVFTSPKPERTREQAMKEAQNIVLKFLDTVNRPMSVLDISSRIKMSSSVTQMVLESIPDRVKWQNTEGYKQYYLESNNKIN